MRLSSRAAAIGESETLRLWRAVAERRAVGRDVVSLLEGEPSLPVPPEALDAAAEALRAGRVKYSDSAGLPELRAAIARKLREENGVPADAASVLVANGAKQAIYEVLQALCGPGDEVLVPRPYWVTFPEAVRLAGAAPVFVDRLEDAAAAVTPRTRALILNSPRNPTGEVLDRTRLEALVGLAAERDFAVVSDEAYEALVYDGRHLSPASLGADAAARVVTIQTVSKTYGMTGFRVGWASGPADVIAAARAIHGHVTGNVSPFAQAGALAALASGPERRAAWLDAHRRRRDLAFERARRLFDCELPRGGLFLWADARRLLGKRWRDSSALAYHLLAEAGVAVLPGSACGREGWLRLSFSPDEHTLREAFARLESAL